MRFGSHRFHRQELADQRFVACAEASGAKDGQFLKTAGLVLVRQMPGSAKWVMFITVEDETGVANLVVWPTLYEKQRRVILTASMLGIDGRIQREGEVVHLIAYKPFDLSDALASGCCLPTTTWPRRRVLISSICDLGVARSRSHTSGIPRG